MEVVSIKDIRPGPSRQVLVSTAKKFGQRPINRPTPQGGRNGFLVDSLDGDGEPVTSSNRSPCACRRELVKIQPGPFYKRD